MSMTLYMPYSDADARNVLTACVCTCVWLWGRGASFSDFEFQAATISGNKASVIQDLLRRAGFQRHDRQWLVRDREKLVGWRKPMYFMKHNQILRGCSFFLFCCFSAAARDCSELEKTSETLNRGRIGLCFGLTTAPLACFFSCNLAMHLQK